MTAAKRVSRAAFLEAMGAYYDAMARFEAGSDNRAADEAAIEILGMFGEAAAAGGALDLTHRIFRHEATRGGDPQPDADLTDRQIYKGAGPLLFMLRSIMPNGTGDLLASDIAMVGAGIRPTRLAHLLDEIPSTLATDSGTFSVLMGVCGSARYKAALDGVKDWLPAHRKILPGDEADRPDDKTRREWMALCWPDHMDKYAQAGSERRISGPDGYLPPDLAMIERHALATIEKPAENAKLIAFVKLEKSRRRRR